MPLIRVRASRWSETLTIVAVMQFVTDVDTPSFTAAVVERSFEVPVIVDFWAEWCGPCKVLGPILEHAVEASGGSVELAKVDVDRNQQLAGQFGVQGIPTVVGFKNGQAVSRFTGALPDAQVREWIDQLKPSQLDLTVTRAEGLLERGEDTEAETLLNLVLAEDATHQDAGIVLAGILLDRGDAGGALALLGRLSPTEEVQQLRATARLASAESIDVNAAEAALAQDPDDHAARLDLAKASAARGDVEAALEDLLRVVESRAEEADEARQAMVDIFEIRGSDDPLVRSYRQRLASALF